MRLTNTARRQMVLSAIYVVTFFDSYLTESNKVLVWLMWGT